MTNLIIPKSKNITGLYIYCNKCKSKSKTQLKTTPKCSHPADKQVYKAIITIAGTTSVRTRTLGTRDLDEAMKETIDFECELKANDYQRVEEKKIQEKKPVTIIECICMYLDFLENKNVYEHQVRFRTTNHIKQISSYLDRFVEALSKGGIKTNGLLVRHINNTHAEVFYSHLLKQSFANRTFNRHIDTVSELFNYLIDIKQYNLVNYFSSINIPRKKVNSKIESISIKEFKELLNIIKPETGIEILADGQKKQHYYEWIKDAIELGLYTGRRRDEIIHMKFSDILELDGKPIFIETEDYKNNLRNNLYKKEEKKYNYSPIILDLNLFLQRIGYNEYKGTDRYLIAHDSLRTRATLKDDMSKSFTHYYGQLNTGKNLSFKHLRKTYITMLNNYTNGSAEIITGHSGQGVIMNNYHDKKMVQEVLTSFKMIG